MASCLVSFSRICNMVSVFLDLFLVSKEEGHEFSSVSQVKLLLRLQKDVWNQHCCFHWQSVNSYQLAKSAPYKGKSYRKIFRLLGGIPTYLVQERNTSKQCSNCRSQENTCVHFLKRQNPRPYKGNVIDVWGLLRCNSCGATHDR